MKSYKEIALDRALVLLYSGATLASSFVLLKWPTFTAAAVMVILQVVFAFLAERVPVWRKRRRTRERRRR